MYCIKRKPREDIILELEDGRQITIGLSSTNINDATFCVDAPKSIRIMKAELCRRVLDTRGLVRREISRDVSGSDSSH